MNTTLKPEADIRLQASSPAQDYLLEGGAQGAEEKQPAKAYVIGGQIVNDRERAQSGQAPNERVGKTGKRGGQLSDDGMSENDGQDGQIAQVISLAPAHPNSGAGVGDAATPANPTPDDAFHGLQPADRQDASWLKSLLPEPQSGWWEVSVKGKGFAVKFRWRDTERQTLLFPQITGEHFIALKQNRSEEAARILRERISANLHSFLLNPAKRDKALAVAVKLGIDLPYPPYTH